MPQKEGLPDPLEPKRANEALARVARLERNLLAGISGAGAGVVVDPLSGPPVAIAVNEVLGEIAADFFDRRLSPIEESRMSAAVLFATMRIQQRIEAGEVPRQDGFFEGTYDCRSAAAEIAEGVLKAAQESHEQRRVAHLGFLLASIPFRSDISVHNASYLLDTARRMTWRQMVALAVLGEGRRRE